MLASILVICLPDVDFRSDLVPFSHPRELMDDYEVVALSLIDCIVIHLSSLAPAQAIASQHKRYTAHVV